MQALKNQSDLDAVLGAPDAILLKHGAHCPISAGARDELAEFAERHPDLTIAGVEVTQHSDLSKAVADRLGVPHESPQVFVLHEGKVAWKADHHDITARALEAQVGGVKP